MILIDTDIYKIQTSSFQYQTNQDSCYIMGTILFIKGNSLGYVDNI